MRERERERKRYTGKIVAPRDKYDARLGYVTAGCVRARDTRLSPSRPLIPLAILYAAASVSSFVSPLADCKYATAELT